MHKQKNYLEKNGSSFYSGQAILGLLRMGISNSLYHYISELLLRIDIRKSVYQYIPELL